VCGCVGAGVGDLGVWLCRGSRCFILYIGNGYAAKCFLL